MVKNGFRQKQLDEIKWQESEKDGFDKSGLMPYCEACDRVKTGYFCTATQEEREKECLCAKAYNRIRRKWK